MPRPETIVRTSLLLVLLFTASIVVVAPAAGQRPTNREAMWPAPTEADWKKPVPIVFQRTWEDAVAVSRRTSKPILVCINMDGEIASEHYAGIRYRDPAIARLYEPYVCVIASTYRHTPRDHDEHGHRVLCPRFGSVTCGEHIQIEPILFEKFMEGKRIAPRHIMVELDQSEVYDVYYALDTASVFKQIGDGIANRKVKAKPQVRGDRTLLEKVASPDVVDRNEVERAFIEGDEKVRRALLRAAAHSGTKAPIELLRLGVHGFDEGVSRLARAALLESGDREATDLIARSLAAPLEDAEKRALISALERRAPTDPKARRYVAVQRGLDGSAGTVKSGAWDRAIAAGAPYAPAPEPVIAGVLRGQDRLWDSKKAADQLELARAFLARARAEENERLVRDALLADTLEAARSAEAVGDRSWSSRSIMTVATYLKGDVEAARRLAIDAMAFEPEDAQGPDGMIVVGLFAEARRNAISDAVRDGKEWPPSWLADLDTAYGILAEHPFGEPTQVTMHYDFLNWLGAYRKADRVLMRGVDRFQDSPDVHDRLRTHILRRRGVRRLERTYEKLLNEESVHPAMRWYAGYASLVAAEFHRRRGRSKAAVDAYGRGMAHFRLVIDEAATPAAEDDDAAARAGRSRSARHFIAMAHGGLARVHYEAGKNEDAVDEVLRSFELSPGSAATLDGLNISAADTAKMLRERLGKTGAKALLERLTAAMAELDPKLLGLPAYENPGGAAGGRPGGR